jgi:WD40 repeat protein
VVSFSTVDPASMSDDGRLALSTGDDIVLWQLGAHSEVGTVLRSPGGYQRDRLTVAAGRGAILLSDPGTFGPVLVFDLESGEVTHRLPRGTGSSPALSPDGRLVAFQEESEPGWLGTVVVHDLETGTVARMQGMCPQSGDAPPGAECAPFPQQPFAGLVWTLYFTPDGSKLVADVGDGVVVWNTATGEILRTEDPFWHVALMANSETLVLLKEDNIEVGDVAGGPMEKHEVRSGYPRFNADGSRLATGFGHAELGFIAVYDTATWSELCYVPVEAAAFFRDLTIAPDGSKVATGGRDGSVRVYDAQSCNLLQTIPVGGDVTNVEFVNDDHVLAVPRSGPGYIVTTDVNELLHLAEDRLTRTFTREECDTYRIDPCPAEPEAG